MKVYKFGTLSGVFTPSILTILGVIMYLRLPMIVGEAGLWPTLGIIILAHIISVTTGLSVSSIATDKKVEAGGTYYMISRSLGLPIGGTLGLALFVGLSFSVSLYLIGFSESFLNYWEFEISTNTIRITGTIILLVVTTITFISTSLAIKTQYFILALILLSLISIFFGNHEFLPETGTTIEHNMSGTIPLMVLFGIFFPAVTGFEAGVSMSGDLKNPKLSIPKGTILAILVGLVVYILLTFFFATTVDHEMLVNDPQVLLKIAWLPQLVIAGIWGATLSSALGSILGAPRILQATASDKITPRIFAKGFGAANEPRNALIMTFVIAETGILIGDLDVIARVVSIFFITTYGFLNLSCAFEAWTSADFRPSFKTPIWVSFLGALACFIVMIELDFVATLSAVFILGGLYLYLKRRELFLQKGDAWAGVWSSLAKTSIQRLIESKQHTRNWRPNILMFSGDDQTRPYLTNLGKAIAGNLGMLSSFEFSLSKDGQQSKPKQISKSKNGDSKYFHHTYTCANVYAGVDELSRVYGFAGLEPNTVLMGWSIKDENQDSLVSLMQKLQRYNLNALFLYNHAAEKKITIPTIDVWWSGWGRNLSLALNVLRHLTNSDPWKNAKLRICMVLNTSEDTDRINRFIKTVLEDYRLTTTVNIFENHITRQSKQEVIAKESAQADLVIVGIPDSSYNDLQETYHYACSICSRLQSVLFINASDKLEEHTIVSQVDTSDISSQHIEWTLPPVETSPYVEINEDIKKIDEHSFALQNLLYKKVFVPLLDPETKIYNRVISFSGDMIAVLNKSGHYDLTYQRHNVLTRTKRHFFDQLIRVIEETHLQLKKDQEERLQSGLTWYIQQLEKDVALFPKQKIIQHPRSEFLPRKEDHASLRWTKLKNRMLHPFSGNSISLTTNYREGASYFFKDSRHHFLVVLLDALEKNILASQEKFNLFLHWIDDSFYDILKTDDRHDQDRLIQNMTVQIKDKAEELRRFSTDSQSLYQGRLQVEHRRNLNFFMHQLERIDFNQTVRKNRKVKKFYATKREALTSYPEKLSQITSIGLSTTTISLLLYNYADLVHDHIRHYTFQLSQFFEKQEKKIVQLVETLKAVSQAQMDPNQFSLPEMDFAHTQPIELFEEISTTLRSLVNTLPEEVVLSNQAKQNPEVLNLPLRAMAAHLTETVLIGPINDSLAVNIEKIKKSQLIIKDIASLAMFNVFNTEDLDNNLVSAEEIDHTIQSIDKEVKILFALFDAGAKDIINQPSALKVSLKLHNLIELSGNFSSKVRSYKKRNLLSRIKANINTIRDSVKHFLVTVLYSQAKGVLLARHLSSQVGSTNERIIMAVAKATPNHQLLQKLPHFYVSLFSGRSNIGDNFWITRPWEENQFESAYQRYLDERQGIILILGERNTGKTALSKRLGSKHTKDFKVFHLFPPDEGSVKIEEFDSALRKVTKLEGTSAQVLGLLPHNSMVVIHDLELWWERTFPEGLLIIQYIKTLVKEFAPKCLFVINTNPFAFDVINTVEPLDTYCLSVIRCQPFNSFELKQMIMSRHQSSALALDFGAGTNSFSEIRLARIFNKLFSYSKGNPGVTMSSWLNGIKEFSNQTIEWTTPEPIEEEVFNKLPDIWSHIGLQLLIHKRMGLEKMVRTINADKVVVAETLAVMKQLQLISVHGHSTYFLNPTIEFSLVSMFRKKGWVS